MGPPRFGEPESAGAGGAPSFSVGMVPRGTSHRMRPVSRLTATSAPKGGRVHGRPVGPIRRRRRITKGVPSIRAYSQSVRPRAASSRRRRSPSNPSLGKSWTTAGTRLTGTTAILRAASAATPPQCAPPMLPGTASVPSRLGGVKMPSFRKAAI